MPTSCGTAVVHHRDLLALQSAALAMRAPHGARAAPTSLWLPRSAFPPSHSLMPLGSGRTPASPWITLNHGPVLLAVIVHMWIFLFFAMWVCVVHLAGIAIAGSLRYALPALLAVLNTGSFIHPHLGPWPTRRYAAPSPSTPPPGC